MAEILQSSSGLLTGKIIDNSTGQGIAGSTLLNLTLTLYDRDTNAIINGRNGSVLTPGTVVDGSGNLSYTIDPADSPLVTATKSEEVHVARFIWTYGAPVKTGKVEIQFTVRALTTPA